MHEAHAELFRHGAHALLRRLHEERQRGILLAHQAAQVDAGVDLLLLRPVALMDDETDVGDDADDVGLVFLIIVVGLVVARGHQDLGTGALAQELLLLVERVAHRLAVLLEDQLVEQRQVG